MADPHLPTIHFYPYKEPIEETVATFAVWLQGVRPGQKLELTIFEIEKTKDGKGSEKEVGKIKGKAVPRKGPVPSFTIEPEGEPPAPPPAQDPPKPTIAFVLRGRPEKYIFEIPVERYNDWEGEQFTFEIRLTDPKAKSAQFVVAHVRRQLPVGEKATYDWHAHNEVKFYHHGSENEAGSSGAFHDILDAINNAKSFIFIADWTFQAHFRIDRGPTDNSATIGAALAAAARKPELLVGVHTWDHTNIAAPDEQNDHGVARLDETAGGKRPERLLWRASSRDAFGMSHHQKFVVLDVDAADGSGRREIKAFFGGLDLTKGRFDWGKHPIDPKGAEAPGFKRAIASGRSWRGTTGIWLSKTTYDDWYNAEFADDPDAPREPWHDIHGQIVGPAAWDVVREFVGRWNVDPDNSAQGDTNDKAIEAVNDKFLSLFKGKPDGVPNDKQFVQQFEPRKKSPWAAQVYRSLASSHWARSANSPEKKWKDHKNELKWSLQGGFEKSIQHAYIRAIDHAEKFIYIETQYFISSGKKWGQSIVANELAERICERIVKKQGQFHCFIITPQYPEGPPDSMGGVAVRQYEWKTMEWMVSELTAKLGPDTWKKHLSFYFPVNWANTPIILNGDRKNRAKVNKRYMIYVHSKLMIVDDRFIIFGSANLNERSLNGGHDSEICIGMWPSAPAFEKECTDAIKKFRVELMEEHLGQNPGLDAPETVSGPIQQIALLNYQGYRLGNRAAEGPLARLPLEWDAKKKKLVHVPLLVSAPDLDEFMPDWPYDVTEFTAALKKTQKSDPTATVPDKDAFRQWTWECAGNWALLGGKIPA